VPIETTSNFSPSPHLNPAILNSQGKWNIALHSQIGSLKLFCIQPCQQYTTAEQIQGKWF